jgi:hypothetical protein
MGRLGTLLLTLATVGAFGRSEACARIVAWLFSGAAELFGPGPVHRAAPFDYYADGHVYQITFWCTPTVLASLAIVALSLRRVPAGRVAALAPVIWVAALGAMALNTVVSLWMRHAGLGWHMSHRPGLSALYAAAGVWLLTGVGPWVRAVRADWARSSRCSWRSRRARGRGAPGRTA